MDGANIHYVCVDSSQTSEKVRNDHMLAHKSCVIPFYPHIHYTCTFHSKTLTTIVEGDPLVNHISVKEAAMKLEQKPERS